MKEIETMTKELRGIWAGMRISYIVSTVSQKNIIEKMRETIMES